MYKYRLVAPPVMMMNQSGCLKLMVAASRNSTCSTWELCSWSRNQFLQIFSILETFRRDDFVHSDMCSFHSDDFHPMLSSLATLVIGLFPFIFHHFITTSAFTWLFLQDSLPKIRMGLVNDLLRFIGYIPVPSSLYIHPTFWPYLATLFLISSSCLLSSFTVLHRFWRIALVSWYGANTFDEIAIQPIPAIS